MANQVRISSAFFKNERNNYSNFSSAFFRELVQNAVDARASRIDITVSQDEDIANVCFEDNGPGFSKEVRDNVYFCLGETTKNDNSTVGGFGKARILTCFSHHKYSIESQDWRCEGSGSSYDVFERDGYLRGCKVNVTVDASCKYGREDMIEALYEYLGSSQTNCAIYVNGELWNRWCYRRKLVRELSFGSVYLNKTGGKKNTLIVRVSGIPMFTRYISPDVQVVVEIDPLRSREVLLSNRDSLHNEYQRELDNFMQTLAVDVKSALRDNSTKVIFFDGKPKVTRRKIKPVVSVDVKNFLDSIQKAEDFANSWSHASIRPAAAQSVRDMDIEHQQISAADELIPSAIMVCETDNPSVRKVVSKYDPANWDNSGSTRRKLLRQWAIVCDIVIEEWLDICGKDEISWRPGFCFSDDAEAMKFQDDSGTGCLLVNPVDSKGKLTYRLRNRNDWVRLMELACHEVTHLSHSLHNEMFSSMYGDLVRRAFCRIGYVFKTLQKSLGKTSGIEEFALS